MALLGGVALMEEVCPIHFLMLADLGVELSAPSTAPCLPGCSHSSRHSDSGLSPLTLNQPQMKCLPLQELQPGVVAHAFNPSTREASTK